MSFIQSITGSRHISSHKRIRIQETIMRTSPHLLTSSFFNPLFFFDNADMVCNIPAHGGCSVTVRISDQMSQEWRGETHMPGTIWKVREWPWLFCHPGKKAKECAKLATVALFFHPDCLSKVAIAFSRGEAELCVNASKQTFSSLEPMTVLKYWNNFPLSCMEISLCIELYSELTYCTPGPLAPFYKSMITKSHMSRT